MPILEKFVASLEKASRDAIPAEELDPAALQEEKADALWTLRSLGVVFIKPQNSQLLSLRVREKHGTGEKVTVEEKAGELSFS